MKTNLKKEKRTDIEHTFYWMSIAVIGMILCSYFIGYLFVEWTGAKSLMQCTLKRYAGIPCPGCGGTRAVWYFLQGDFLKSIYYNAFAFYCVVLYSLFFITQTFQRITHGRIQGMRYRKVYVIAALVVLVIQYVLKLIIPGYIV